MKKSLLVIFLIVIMACDKDSNPVDPPDNPNPPTTYLISIQNHSSSYSGIRIGVAKTIFNGHEYQTWPGDFTDIGTVGPGTYQFQVEIWKQQGTQAGSFYRIGSGNIHVDSNKSLRIYNDTVYWH